MTFATGCELVGANDVRIEITQAECRNVALGHTIKSFDQFFDQIEDKKPVLRLVKKQLKNTRNATRKKAERFLAGHVD
ncbi:MAG: hypothetical protein ACYTE3_07425 [Planctomycetota bacterium]